jgi:hypothetical protein
MRDRWRKELSLVEAAYGLLEIGPDLTWFIVPRWPLPSGWSKEHTRLLVLMPPGFPVTPPDNFYVDPELRIAGGGLPGSVSAESQAGRQWLRFSYHVEGADWSPHAEPEKGHNLLTFLQGVAKRLSEIS